MKVHQIQKFYKTGCRYPNGFIQLLSIILERSHHECQHSLLEPETQLTRQILHQILHYTSIHTLHIHVDNCTGHNDGQDKGLLYLSLNNNNNNYYYYYYYQPTSSILMCCAINAVCTCRAEIK